MHTSEPLLEVSAGAAAGGYYLLTQKTQKFGQQGRRIPLTLTAIPCTSTDPVKTESLP